jgi:Flp pilus assembly protein TadB
MNRSGYRYTSTPVHPTPARRLFAAVLTLLSFVVVSLLGVLLLAGTMAIALVIGARLWWLRRCTGRQPSGRTLNLSKSDYRVLSDGDCRQGKE